MRKAVLCICCLLFMSLCLLCAQSVAKASENPLYDIAYFLDFENEKQSIFEEKGATAKVVEKGIDGKSLSVHFNEDGDETLKLSNFVCQNNTIYTFIFKFTHQETNGNYCFSVGSDTQSYALYRVYFNKNGIVSSGAPNDPIDCKVVELRHENSYSVLKLSLWSGWESDWTVKFGANNGASDLIVDDFGIYVGAAIQTEKYFTAPDGVMLEDGENGTLFGGDFIAANYCGNGAKDGRITSNAAEVISGNYSIAATFADVMGWQPFVYSSVQLNIGKVYTLAFDYKCVAGSGEMSVNISHADNTYYRLINLNSDGITGCESNISDDKIGTGATPIWTDRYFGEHNCACYCVNRGDYFSVKFTFVCPQEGALVKFVRRGDTGTNNDTRFVIDNIRVTEGTTDVVPCIDRTVDEVDESKVIFIEKFEQNGDYDLNSQTVRSTDISTVIADNGSIHALSSGGWNDFITFPTSIKPNSTYVLTAKYRINSMTAGSFGYFNIKSRSNVDDASYIGFNENGSTDFVANIGGALFETDFDYNTVTITFQTGQASDYALVVGGNGTMNVVFDDFVLVEGCSPTYVTDSVIRSNAELLLQEDFEQGYGIFNKVSVGYLPQGVVNSSAEAVINGKYSMCLNSNQWSEICSTSQNIFEKDQIYTILFRVKQNSNSKFALSFETATHGVTYTKAYFDSCGRLVADNSYGTVSYVTKAHNGYNDIRAIISTPNANNLSLTLSGVGNLSFDDFTIYKGRADVSINTLPEYIGGGTSIEKLQPIVAKPIASCNVQSLEGVYSIDVVFSDYVCCPNDVADFVSLKDGESDVKITTTFDMLQKTLTVSWNTALEKGKEYKLTVRGFYDAYGNEADEFVRVITCGKADKQALVAKIDEACKLEKSNYTAESFATLEQAIVNAQIIFENSAPTQSMVDEAVLQLQNAIDNLQHNEVAVQPTDNSGVVLWVVVVTIIVIGCAVVTALLLKRKK